METPKIYETQNLDLAAYLMGQGIDLLETKLIDPYRRLIIFRFVDKYKNCSDLERAFLSSPEKKYRDIHKYLLKKTHEYLRELGV